MRPVRPARLWVPVWALLAVLLHAHAFVISAAMGAGAAPSETRQAMAVRGCGMAMAGGSVMHAPPGRGRSPQGKAVCSYCADAACVGVLSAEPELRGSEVLAYTAFTATSPRALASPEAVLARARGPPPALS